MVRMFDTELTIKDVRLEFVYCVINTQTASCVTMMFILFLITLCISLSTSQLS